MDVVLLIASFALIFIGSALFTNGVEWVGHKFKLSESMTGSVVAAIGTGMPEVVIPLIAILLVGGTGGGEVGIGAILGAPFTLATLAMFITGLAAFSFKNRRKQKATLNVSGQLTQRDMGFFILAYLGAVCVSVIPEGKAVTALLFVGVYVGFVWKVSRTPAPSAGYDSEPLTLGSMVARLKMSEADPNPPTLLVVAQTAVAVALIVSGARLFVSQIVSLAELLHVNATLIALIFAPLATELPEQLNSVRWLRQGKDQLALGNIGGTMVFQTCILVALGITLTTWTLAPIELISALLAIAAGFWVYLLSVKNRFSAAALLVNGALYLLYLLVVLSVR